MFLIFPNRNFFTAFCFKNSIGMIWFDLKFSECGLLSPDKCCEVKGCRGPKFIIDAKHKRANCSPWTNCADRILNKGFLGTARKSLAAKSRFLETNC